MYVRTMIIYLFVLANLQLAVEDSRKSPTSMGEEEELIEDILF